MDGDAQYSTDRRIPVLSQLNKVERMSEALSLGSLITKTFLYCPVDMRVQMIRSARCEIAIESVSRTVYTSKYNCNRLRLCRGKVVVANCLR